MVNRLVHNVLHMHDDHIVLYNMEVDQVMQLLYQLYNQLPSELMYVDVKIDANNVLDNKCLHID
jgi:hypothetical protein